MPDTNETFDSVLVANRGEIAVRIIRTLREMSIRPVAVYSEFDRDAPHVALAEEAIQIGPANPSESYLNIDRILEAAEQSGVDAIHPGYGFLSENPEFALACREEDVTFIGPSPSSIEKIGNKVQARSLVDKANVPTVPGQVLKQQDARKAREQAEEIGFPVLVKAASGGGGKGMRVIEEAKEFENAFREARGEAESSFGDPTVFLEKYFAAPRHVEVQILGDRHGNVVHLGERECSIQRRHQKLIEEAPSPVLEEDLRKEMGQAALRVAREADYQNAGTVEFLLDQEGNFYFLEVNTRLQVEHPVTEFLTGIDLVREQVRIASGEDLSYSFEEVPFRGAAIECRICAEDPDSNFMPDAGTIHHLSFPSGPFTRFDAGVENGSEIGMQYDSLMGKLITWAPGRTGALDRMKRALKELTVVGVQTTIPLYHRIMDEEQFRKGEISTRYLETLEKEKRDPEAEQTAAAIAATLARREEERYRAKGNSTAIQHSSPWFQSGLRRQTHHD